jgi:Acetyltransferase (GNAT) domain
MLSPSLARRRAASDTLRLPPRCTARSLCDPDTREAVTRWLRASPDHTLYHLPPYIDFLREQNGTADVLLIAREGNPLLALPVHSWDATGVDGGYSGVVFPATDGEGVLRRSVLVLAELLAVNRHIPFRLCQSAQARTYDDLARVTLLQFLLESAGIELDPVYVRLCPLERLPAAEAIPVAPGRHPGALAIDGDWLAGEPLGSYDHATRKKIRNAIQAGLTVEYVCAHDPTLRDGAYERFQPLHSESWTRTGLLPKPPGYWPRMSGAVAAAGGKDLVVLTLDRDGKPLAGVICHAYDQRGIYWSGCTSARGLELQANPLCMHAAILACRRQGVRTYELGRFRAEERSAKERSVTHYKSHFGGTLVRATSFSSTPAPPARVRAAGAAAAAEAMRRLSVALGRARAGRGRASTPHGRARPT